jgi:hypothetical protein
MQRPVSRASILTSFVATLGVALAGTASGQSVLYHSPAGDGAPPASPPPTLATTGPEWLNLYVDRSAGGATATGVPCEDGEGEEVCGWEVVLKATPGAAFEAFSPSDGVEFVLTPTEFKANGLSAVAPGTDPLLLGYLGVESTDALTGGTISVESGSVVTSDLSLDPIAADDVAVVPLPEPGAWLQLGSSIAGLAALAAWRKRRRR